jgi:hypothetical protein
MKKVNLKKLSAITNFDATEYIISNRVKLIEDYEIIKKCPKPRPKKITKYVEYLNSKGIMLDHAEAFKDKYGRFVITNSPYSDRYETGLLEEGFIKINPMFSCHALSYIKIL